MTKFKIELDLDWMEEGADIDQMIKDEVISNLQSRFIQKTELRMEQILNDKMEEISTAKIDEFLEKTLQAKVETLLIPHKKKTWDSEFEMLPVSEFIGLKYEEFLNKKVYDRDGNKPRYSDDAKLSVHEFIVNKYLEKELVGKVNDLIRTARQDAEEQVIKTLEDNLKAQLSADIINRLNIPHMLQSLQEKATLFESNELPFE